MTLQAKPSTAPVPLRPPRLPLRDNEFLPAALEILETPLSPIRGSLLLALCGFVAAALAWSYFGQVDIIGVAQGKIQVVGRTKMIEPLETGKVARVAVENGRRVAAGDVLLELDAGEAKAEEAALEASLQSARAEVARRNEAVALASSGQTDHVSPIVWPAGLPLNVTQREQRVLEGDLRQLSRSVGSLEAQKREKLAERDRLDVTITAQRQLVAVLKERVDMRSTLLENASGSKASLIDAQETYSYHAATLAAEQGQLGEAQAGIGSIQADIDKAFASFLDDNVQRLATAERDAEDTEQKLAKARVKTSHMTLTSPIDGVVQGLTVTSSGQVVTTGEQIMQVVPAGSGLEVEAYLPNSDVGFARADQPAVVKVESFPYTTYGTLSARVVRVGSDAIPMSEANSKEQNPTEAEHGTTFGGAQRVQNLVYPITLTLDRTSIVVDGAPVPLVPGMAVTAEIVTGKRRILDYLFAPLAQVTSTAMHER